MNRTLNDWILPRVNTAALPPVIVYDPLPPVIECDIRTGCVGNPPLIIDDPLPPVQPVRKVPEVPDPIPTVFGIPGHLVLIGALVVMYLWKGDKSK